MDNNSTVRQQLLFFRHESLFYICLTHHNVLVVTKTIKIAELIGKVHTGGMTRTWIDFNTILWDFGCTVDEWHIHRLLWDTICFI